MKLNLKGNTLRFICLTRWNFKGLAMGRTLIDWVKGCGEAKVVYDKAIAKPKSVFDKARAVYAKAIAEPEAVLNKALDEAKALKDKEE
jgi:hypothetical protein